MERSHWRIGETLNDNLDPKDFDDILNATYSFLTRRDIGRCENMNDLFHTLHKKGKIKVGSYESLYDIINASKLIHLIGYVEKEEKVINRLKTIRKHNATDMEEISPTLSSSSVQVSLLSDIRSSVVTTRDTLSPTTGDLLRNTEDVSNLTKNFCNLGSSLPTQVTAETDDKPLLNQQITLPDQPKTHDQHVEKDQLSRVSTRLTRLNLYEAKLKQQITLRDQPKTHDQHVEKDQESQPSACSEPRTPYKPLLNQQITSPDQSKNQSQHVKKDPVSQSSSCPKPRKRYGVTGDGLHLSNRGTSALPVNIDSHVSILDPRSANRKHKPVTNCCSKCGEKNHKEMDCWYKCPVRCHRCSLYGHKSKFCVKK